MAGDRQAVGQESRHVLQGMDGEIDAALLQGFFELFREESLAAAIGQGPVGDSVAAGAYNDRLERSRRGQLRMRCFKPRAKLGSLAQSELAAAAANAQK